MIGHQDATRQAADDGRYRIAHLALLIQGTAVAALGGIALAWSMANVRFGAEGMPLFGLTVTPWHGALLMSNGVLAVLACLSRRTTVVFAALATAGWTALTVISVVGTCHHAPGVLGFDVRDTVFDGTVALYDLAVLIVLLPAVLPIRLRTWGPRSHVSGSSAAGPAR